MPTIATSESRSTGPPSSAASRDLALHRDLLDQRHAEAGLDAALDRLGLAQQDRPVAGQRRRTQQPLDSGVERRARLARQQHSLAQVADRDLAARGPEVVGRDDRHQPVVHERRDLQPGVVGRRADQRQLDRVGRYHVEQLGGVPDGDPHHALRVQLAVAAEQVGQQVGGQRVADAQAQRAVGQAGGGAGRLGRGVGQRQDLLGVGQQRLAGRRELQPPRQPLDQRRADLRLQRRDLLRDGRLRQIQRLGRAREVAQPRDGREDAQFGDVHAIKVRRVVCFAPAGRNKQPDEQKR